MADEEDVKDADATENPEGEEGAEGGKKSKKKLFIIIIAALVLIGGGAGGAYYAGLFGGGEEHAAEGEEHGEGGTAEEQGDKKKKTGLETFYDLPEFLVNLNTTSRQSSFLKMSVVLELKTAEDTAIVEANLPRIVDVFNTYLRELRPSDLYGSAGLYRLREEMMVRVNKIIAPAVVEDILFKQVLIQ